MTKKQLAQKSLEIIAEHRRTVSAKDRFEQMVSSGIINENGEVLVTREEREAGHPVEHTVKQ